MITDSFDYYQYLIFRIALFIIFVDSTIKLLANHFPILSRAAIFLRDSLKSLAAIAVRFNQSVAAIIARILKR